MFLGVDIVHTYGIIESRDKERRIKMTVNEMIKKYRLTLAKRNGEDAIRVGKKVSKATIEEIRKAKPEIIAELKRREAEKKAAYEARQARINAIEGLKELQRAIAAEEAYREALNDMMEDEYNDGARPPKKPEISVKELKEKYPRAAAYLKAENWSLASNYIKAGAGQKAKERIISGEDYNQVIAEMEKEWSDYCKERMWD